MDKHLIKLNILMKKLLTLVFVLSAFVVSAQNMGSIKVQNFGNFYRLSVNTFPAFYPKPDSLSLRITVICQSTMQWEQSFVPKDGYVDYKLGSYNYVGITVFRWKKINGTWFKIGQTSIPTTCVFGLNPIACYQKQ